MRYIVYALAVLFLLSTVISCGQAKKAPAGKESTGSEPGSTLKKGSLKNPEMADFPETVFNDMKERFEQDGIILIELKRTGKGETSLVQATIDGSQSEVNVPKALVQIAKNFSTMEDIKVISGKGGKEYTLSVKRVNEIMERCETEDGDINTMLWGEISGIPVKKEESGKDKSVQSAGI